MFRFAGQGGVWLGAGFRDSDISPHVSLPSGCGQGLSRRSRCRICFVTDPFLQGCANCFFSLETDACVLVEKVVRVSWDLGQDFFSLCVGLYPFRCLDGIVTSFRLPR